MDIVCYDIITEIPSDFAIAEIRDFYHYDSRTRIKTYKIDIPFIIQYFDTLEYSLHFTTEYWNDISISTGIEERPFIWTIKGIGNDKMLTLATYIQYNKCWVRIIDKHKNSKLPPKPLTPAQTKAKKKKEIFSKSEF